MNKNNITFRLEKEEDHREVENLVRESFWNVYRPGCLEHYVLHQLRTDKDFVPELSFVMEKDGKIIGQNVFVRTVIKADDGRDIPIMTMGPICITPELKDRDTGSFFWIIRSNRQQSSDAEHFASKGTLTSMARVDLIMLLNSASDTTDFRKAKTFHSSFVKS